jgi:hypothetical protein
MIHTACGETSECNADGSHSLAYTAFIDVLELKQSQYRPVLAWLKAETVRLDVERLLGRKAQELM